jgi:hypothetical protein
MYTDQWNAKRQNANSGSGDAVNADRVAAKGKALKMKLIFSAAM